MKYVDFNERQWLELKLCFDTCVVPYIGFIGTETPLQMKDKWKKMYSALDVLERAFTGRIVIYPAIQYAYSAQKLFIENLCERLQSCHFTYVIIVYLDENEWCPNTNNKTTLHVTLKRNQDIEQQSIYSQYICHQIQQLWK